MVQKKKRLHSYKEDGLWIQCSNKNCEKWRFVREYNDPLSVPETWICSQNLDKKFSSCDIPQEKIKGDLIESKYIPGNIVWAKIKGFPWWPGIVDQSPETQTFYKVTNSNIPVSYYVTFFEEGKTQSAWVKPNNIKPFKEDDGDQPTKRAKKVKSHEIYKESLQKSLVVARSVMSLDIDKRLRKYSLLAQLKQWEAEKNRIAISQDMEKIPQISLTNRRPKRKVGHIKYITTDTDSERKSKKIETLVYNDKDQKIALIDRPENKQITLHSSVFKFNQISLINPQRWIHCIIL